VVPEVKIRGWFQKSLSIESDRVQRLSAVAASVSPTGSFTPAPEALRDGTSDTVVESGTEKLEIARSFEKVNLPPDVLKSIFITSPNPICPVAIKFEIG